MTDTTLQKKLDQIAKLSCELTAEAKKRWGKDAQLFLEPETGFFLMDGDALEDRDRMAARHKHIKFRCRGIAQCEAGGW